MFETELEKMLSQYLDAVDDKRRFTGLIKDYFFKPEDVKSVNLLLMAYNMGIVEDIQRTARITNAFAYRYVKQLMDDYGMSRVNADWIVSVWCVCFGARTLGKACEIKLQQQGAGPSIKEEQGSNAGKKYGELFTYRQSQNGNGLAVAGFMGNMRQTVIFQNYFEGKPIIEIGDELFAEEQIEEAILTDGIKFIGKGAFRGCKKLHQAVIPMSMKEICDSGYEGCESLKSVNLPEGIERIGHNAFRNCGLKNIIIPKSIYWFGNEVFAGCEEMDNIKIPSNIDRITEGMFEGCISLKKIQFHEQLERIENRAFYGCCNLDFVVIPDSVNYIGEDAFTGTDKRFIIQCSFGSYAEQYCRKNKIKYQLV